MVNLVFCFPVAILSLVIWLRSLFSYIRIPKVYLGISALISLVKEPELTMGQIFGVEFV